MDLDFSEFESPCKRVTKHKTLVNYSSYKKIEHENSIRKELRNSIKKLRSTFKEHNENPINHINFNNITNANNANNLNNVNSSKKKSNTNNNIITLCEKHNRPLEVFCLDDRCKVCTQCALFEDHKNHQIKSEEEIINEIQLRAEIYVDLFELLEMSENSIMKNVLINSN